MKRTKWKQLCLWIVCSMILLTACGNQPADPTDGTPGGTVSDALSMDEILAKRECDTPLSASAISLSDCFRDGEMGTLGMIVKTAGSEYLCRISARPAYIDGSGPVSRPYLEVYTLAGGAADALLQGGRVPLVSSFYCEMDYPNSGKDYNILYSRCMTLLEKLAQAAHGADQEGMTLALPDSMAWDGSEAILFWSGHEAPVSVPRDKDCGVYELFQAILADRGSGKSQFP